MIGTLGLHVVVIHRPRQELKSTVKKQDERCRLEREDKGHWGFFLEKLLLSDGTEKHVRDGSHMLALAAGDWHTQEDKEVQLALTARRNQILGEKCQQLVGDHRWELWVRLAHRTGTVSRSGSQSETRMASRKFESGN